MNSQQTQEVFSFEFFPPRTPEGVENLRKTRAELAELNPAYFSVTFGAGGSTQKGTLETVVEIQQSGINAAPHISCIGSEPEEIRNLLQQYKDANIRRLVALRGDMPSGMHTPGCFRYANELVSFIRSEFGDHFHIEVAAYPEMHPQASNYAADLNNFKQKIEAGADSAITQYFYNPDAYFRFVDDCRKLGVNAPIVPGIMPITNYKQLARFSDACGAEIPRWVRKRLEAYDDDMESIREFGFDVTLDLCRKLLEWGVPGLHFYAMNRSEPARRLWQELGL
ncbi:MAG: methylenetetrahydrofolate reductase [NAD(P)H] [Gammaproteobacteria bacterium]|nr:methylenetetrahydrofolate reductase [NAD(P)H] [Gammaproteobacteria bacterium]MDH5694067.1 methylenetetrahydrofolate reductase [NAD(P)H] [Gammaproteobacteria bacterium]